MSEYVFNCIIKHVNTPDGPQYVIRWYIYDEKNEISKPAKKTVRISVMYTGDGSKDSYQ